MRIRTEFPRDVALLEDVRIPLRDGTRLTATIWLPDDAADSPVPALLEYLPYRRGDWTAPRDAQRHPWYAGHGYASVRVDIRGCGDSDGVMLDEYHQQEQVDGVEVVEWLASQPWCTGKVGMFGISWGGFNSLQIAAERPEALKAIVTVCSTDDRYADDVHYFGGSVLGIDMVSWAGTMLAFQCRPPAPWRVGERWETMWKERLNALQPFAEIWMDHQERDDYWRRGSVCEDFTKIEAAVMAVGGWADPYRSAVLRILEGLEAPARGLIGPWSHQYPDIDRTPGPAIGFLQETLRWWDHWLKGIDTGIMDEPALRALHQDSVRPATHYPVRSGTWVGLESWPSARVNTASYNLATELRGTATDADQVAVVSTAQHTGIDAGRWFPYGNLSDLPPDQRAEDGRSVVFETPELDRDLNIFGFAGLHIRISSTTPRNTLFARLCDVAPDGSSTLITRGGLNLTKRKGMDRADDVVPGEFGDADLQFKAISWQVPAGHKLRLALSNTYWPWIWPHGEQGALTIDTTESVLSLDILDQRVLTASDISFEEAEQAAPLPIEPGPELTPRPEREIRYTPEDGTWTLTVDPNFGGNRVYPDGLRYGEEAVETYRIREDDPTSAAARSQWKISMERDDWNIRIETSTTVTATPDHYLLHHTVITYNGEDIFFEKEFTKQIPRTSA